MKNFTSFSEHFVLHGETGPIEYQYFDSKSWKPIDMPSFDELQKYFDKLTCYFIIYTRIMKLNYMH
jgi:hypothetical protein